MRHASSVLSLVEPDLIAIEIETDDKKNKTLHIRPFSLRDERWLAQEFDHPDLSHLLLDKNDASQIIKVFCHQLVKEDGDWLAEQYGVKVEELADHLFENLPADPHQEPNPAQAIISAVFLARSKSFPEELKSTLKKNKQTSLRHRLMRWLCLFASGFLAGVMTSIVYWDGLRDGYLWLMGS